MISRNYRSVSNETGISHSIKSVTGLFVHRYFSPRTWFYSSLCWLSLFGCNGMFLTVCGLEHLHCLDHIKYLLWWILWENSTWGCNLITKTIQFEQNSQSWSTHLHYHLMNLVNWYTWPCEELLCMSFFERIIFKSDQHFPTKD